jgi:hypothetical protein
MKIKEDMVAIDDGWLCKLTFTLEVPPIPISVQVKSKEEPKNKEDKTQLEKKMQIADFHVVRKLR